MFFPHCRNLWTLSQWLFQCMLCHYVTDRYWAHPCLKPHCLNYITDSNVSCSFADTVTGAVIGLQAQSWDPIKDPLWVLPRMLCYTIRILFSWSILGFSEQVSGKKTHLQVQFQSQMNLVQIFTNASILGY